MTTAKEYFAAIDHQELKLILTEFVEGLLKRQNIEHTGNCLAMSEILQWYLRMLEIRTEIINVKVKEGGESINHYCLKIPDGTIIDGTASQFKGMPKVYIGLLPEYYKQVLTTH